MDEQLKERDVKYSDLDSKFSRLHKRAKQRIQEVQKVNQSLGFLIMCVVSCIYAMRSSISQCIRCSSILLCILTFVP